MTIYVSNNLNRAYSKLKKMQEKPLKFELVNLFVLRAGVDDNDNDDNDGLFLEWSEAATRIVL